MIKGWIKKENGDYLVDVRLLIDDVLTWRAKEHLSWELTDAACEEAIEYMRCWRPEEGPWVDQLEDDIKVGVEGVEPCFCLKVLLQYDEEGIK